MSIKQLKDTMEETKLRPVISSTPERATEISSAEESKVQTLSEIPQKRPSARVNLYETNTVTNWCCSLDRAETQRKSLIPSSNSFHSTSKSRPIFESPTRIIRNIETTKNESVLAERICNQHSTILIIEKKCAGILAKHAETIEAKVVNRLKIFYQSCADFEKKFDDRINLLEKNLQRIELNVISLYKHASQSDSEIQVIDSNSKQEIGTLGTSTPLVLHQSSTTYQELTKSVHSTNLEINDGDSNEQAKSLSSQFEQRQEEKENLFQSVNTHYYCLKKLQKLLHENRQLNAMIVERDNDVDSLRNQVEELQDRKNYVEQKLEYMTCQYNKILKKEVKEKSKLNFDVKASTFKDVEKPI